ncbi:MAG: hypothetical protein L0Y56_19475 [Nitrospira sp.]|nr:hypothetical protein [Nitrospira sp.]
MLDVKARTSKDWVATSQKAGVRGKMAHGDTWFIILFLLPTLAFLIFLLWLPFLQGVWMSFHNWPFPGEPKWVGLQNYRDFLKADYFWTSIRVTAIYSLSTVFQLGVALIAALTLNQKFIPL